MEKKSQRQPGEAPRSVNPAAALSHCERCITTIINSLQNFQNRKELTDKPLQNYINELNEITKEISLLKMGSSKDESKRFNKLLQEILAVIRYFDKAKEAWVRKNNHISHVDKALIKLQDAITECRHLSANLKRKKL